MEKTFVMLKPDAVRRKLVGEIMSRFEKRDLNITNIKMFTLSREITEEHYAHVSHESIYEEMIDFMTSGPVVAMVIQGENVIKIVRDMVGKRKTYNSSPGTIRGDLGSHDFENLIHAADSDETAEEEIRRFLGD